MKEKLYRDRDWLYEHYVDSQESTIVMAQKTDCNWVTIWNWLHKFNIPVRTSGEGTFLVRRNYLDLSDELFDLLEGELLGDGSIVMNGRRSARYHHSSKYKEYVIWLSRTFANLGLEQVGKVNKCWSKSGNAFGYYYISKSYPELVSIRKKWYPDDKKVVPKGLILTPIKARQWFIGDGCLKHRKNGRGCPHIVFSTNAFDKASIDHLLEELRSKEFKVSYRPSDNSIGMSTKSIRDFLSWIGPCPIDCYSYKWSIGGINH